MALALGFGLLCWIVDTLLDYFIFYKGYGTFLQLLITRPPAHEIYIRLVIVVFFMLFGAIVSLQIARRHGAEKALRQSRERYRTFVDNASDAFYLSDAEGKFLDVNEAACVDSGYTREELLNLSITDVDVSFSPDAIAEIIENLPRNESRSVESTYKRKNGETFPVEIRIRSFGPEDHPFCLSLVRDITERRQAEGALEQERNRTQTYLDVAAVAMIALDREGRMTLVNLQGAKLLGYSEEELLGRDWFETCLPIRLRKDVRDVFEKLMAGVVDPVEHYENPILTRDGEERIVAWHNAILRDDKGTIVGTLSSGLDITDQKKADEDKLSMEEYLRQSQKLESIGTLASGVAHEINNPLMGMMNYAELVKDKVQAPKAIEYLKEIGTEGNRIATIVRNLLSFSRQDKEEHSPARIADIIDASLSLVGSHLRKDQIIIELDIPEDLPLLKCRSQQIQQVVINLLTNAHYALNERYPEYDQDKLIRITSRLFERDGEGWIRTTIEDHGTGIPGDVAQRIFDPF
ncbi:PAS domain S-box protein, partial [Candidatus Bipolaricaulota bacterium]|nr:PAS domain S-box protein [Candidatus Bipolaricaulota bacterium]